MGEQQRPAETDWEGRGDRDEHEALSRDSGGVPAPEDGVEAPDRHSSTGTTPNETMVGRVQGQDAGYAGETGAEKRAAAEGER